MELKKSEDSLQDSPQANMNRCERSIVLSDPNGNDLESIQSDPSELIKSLQAKNQELSRENAVLTSQNQAGFQKIGLLYLENKDLRRAREESSDSRRYPGPMIPPASERSLASYCVSDCGRLIELKKELKSVQTTNAELNALVRDLNAKLNAPTPNSNNSGISPSQNPLNAPNPLPQGDGSLPKRRKGGQPGHPPHFRPLFDLDNVDKIFRYAYKPGEEPPCPHCQGKLVRASDSDLRKDSFYPPDKISLKKVEIAEAYICSICGEKHFMQKPEGGFLGSLLSPEYVAEMAMLCLDAHVSIRKITEHFRNAYQIDLSHAFVNNSLRRVGFALLPIYQQMLAALPLEKILWIDESVWKLISKQLYAWVFRGTDLIAYKIGNRSRDTLDSVIGSEFGGVIVCDYFSVYRSYQKDNPKTLIQFCLEHLKRDYQLS
ncbi:MAG: transposase [Deltaproteobacteria bacterium]|nr:transposase [Deltaproteobacteria bacterium]